MKTLASAIILSLLLAGIVAAADAPKVNLDLKSATLKDATDQVASQAGIAIVLDPKAKGSVTVTLGDVDAGQALDVITKMNNLTWKKLQFAKSQDNKVTLDQLKSGILALASMPITGLAVEDPATKTSTMFAKNIPSAPDTSRVGLPAGYTWNTVYVVLAPEELKAASTGKDNKVQSVSQSQLQSMADLVNMSSNDRKQVYQNQWTAAMQLTPQARQQLFQDQMAGMAGLDPQSRSLLMHDMMHAFRGAFGPPQQTRGGRRGN